VKLPHARSPLIVRVTPLIVYGIIAGTCLLLLLVILMTAYGWSFEPGEQDTGQNPIRVAR
jgi:hypothetical protein